MNDTQAIEPEPISYPTDHPWLGFYSVSARRFIHWTKLFAQEELDKIDEQEKEDEDLDK
ncbi:MAG: hypothetical protein IMZ53_10100 [Thermoplasmata archaeon]|nr:hypothetical protein [Thermoplasmata archaeon]